MTYLNIWLLTPRVFEKAPESEPSLALEPSSSNLKQGLARASTAMTLDEKRVALHNENAQSIAPVQKTSNIGGEADVEASPAKTSEERSPEIQEPIPKRRTLSILRRVTHRDDDPGEPPKEEVVLAHWDPDLYLSRIWPLVVLSGISFPALHLVSWNTPFPNDIEMWLWRGSALASICAMLIFMHFPKVILDLTRPLTILNVIPPALYLVSRAFMMVEAFVALRAEDPGIYETYQASSYWLHIL
jgi:hypothetical protein